MYFVEDSVVRRAQRVIPSGGGELEITDLNGQYLRDGQLQVELMGRGMAWLDTGTCDSLHEAGSYIRTLEHPQGLQLGFPEEVASRMGWTIADQPDSPADPLRNIGSGYILRTLSELDLYCLAHRYFR